MKKRILSMLIAISLCTTTFLASPGGVMAASHDFVEGTAEETAPTGWAGGTKDITVTGKTEGIPGKHIVYNIKVKWGEMKFVYDYGGKWDPTTHTYGVGAESGLTEPGWASKYVTGSATTDADKDKIYNNSITVINNSNYPITATLTFVAQDIFNGPSDSDPVKGIFADNQTTLWEQYCSKTSGRGSDGKDNYVINLGTQDTNYTYYTAALKNDTKIRSTKATAFFALYGTPTVADVNDSAGKISVNIKPYVATP